jgi:hypothetical protein
MKWRIRVLADDFVKYDTFVEIVGTNTYTSSPKEKDAILFPHRRSADKACDELVDIGKRGVVEKVPGT